MSDRRADASDLRRLLKRLYRFREWRQRRGLDRLFARQRKAALLGALRRAWPGGYILTDTGELAYVPAPLDGRGERLMFYGFAAPPAALVFAPPGGVAIDVGANLGEWSVPPAPVTASGDSRRARSPEFRRAPGRARSSGAGGRHGFRVCAS